MEVQVVLGEWHFGYFCVRIALFLFFVVGLITYICVGFDDMISVEN